MESNESETLRLLEVEYQRLGVTNDKLDEQRFKIKNWSITAGGVFVALGINTKQITILVAAVPIILFFAFMEIVYLSIHTGVMERNDKIEQLIDLARREGIGPAHDSYEFGVGRNVFKDDATRFRFSKIPEILRARPHIPFFYLGIALSLLGGAVVLAII
jgi:hypothetical protein